MPGKLRAEKILARVPPADKCVLIANHLHGSANPGRIGLVPVQASTSVGTKSMGSALAERAIGTPHKSAENRRGKSRNDRAHLSLSKLQRTIQDDDSMAHVALSALPRHADSC